MITKGGDHWDRIPEQTRAVIVDRIGPVVRVEPLGGMSGATVVRVHGPGGSRVVKRSRSPGETFVYVDLSPVLAGAGIRIPSCDGVKPIATGGAWLVLEDIPDPLPPEGWGTDPAIMTMLAHLHAVSPGVLDPIAGGFRPTWDESLDEAAGRWLPRGTGIRLAAHRERFAALGRVHRVISGDPNPLNWRLDAKGELVLMDWDRIGTGHPAIDVAIAISGLGTRNAFRRGVAAYEAAGRSRPSEPVHIDLDDVIAVKAWTALGILADAEPGGDSVDRSSPAGRLAGVARALADQLPAWLDEVGRSSR